MSIAASNSPGATSLLVLGALVVVAFLVRRGKLQSRSANLNKGERMRPLLITCIDPLISLLIIGPLLWRLVSADAANALGAVGGALAGVVIGYFRANVMFVRAEKGSVSVVLKRSGVEYGLVALLVVLRSLEGQLELHKASAGTVAVSALAALGLVEAFARAGFIIGRYVAHHELPAPLPAPTPSTDGPAAPGAPADDDVRDQGADTVEHDHD
jgi:hypothetical protein